MQVGNLPSHVRDKVLSLQPSDIPLTERRKFYNQLARRCTGPHELKEGLAEMYRASMSNAQKRFEMLKHFLIDKNMLPACTRGVLREKFEEGP